MRPTTLMPDQRAELGGDDSPCLEDCADAGHQQPDDENDADDDAEQNATHNLSSDAGSLGA